MAINARRWQMLFVWCSVSKNPIWEGKRLWPCRQYIACSSHAHRVILLWALYVHHFIWGRLLWGDSLLCDCSWGWMLVAGNMKAMGYCQLALILVVLEMGVCFSRPEVPYPIEFGFSAPAVSTWYFSSPAGCKDRWALNKKGNSGLQGTPVGKGLCGKPYQLDHEMWKVGSLSTCRRVMWEIVVSL